MHVHPKGMLGKKHPNPHFKKGMKWINGQRRLSIQKGCKKGIDPCPNCGGYHKDPWNDKRREEQSIRMKEVMNRPEVKFKLTHKTPEMRMHYSQAAQLRCESPEYIEKLSRATTKQWRDPVSRMNLVSALSVPTKPQLRLFELLTRFFDGLVLEHPVMTKNSYRRLDIAQPSTMLGFEYDGPYWHDIDADHERDRELKDLGWTIIHFRGIDSLTPKNVRQKVSEFIRRVSI